MNHRVRVVLIAAIAIFLLPLSLLGVKLLSNSTNQNGNHNMAPKPPVAKKIPHHYKVHDVDLQDDYHWLRDNDWPDVKRQDVLDYLNAENHYFKEATKDLKTEGDKLFEEMKARIKEDDISVPIKRDQYYYYSFINAGDAYHTYARREGSFKNGEEEVLLDQNAMAAGHDYFAMAGLAVSPDHRYLAYAVDIKGDERYTARIKDLKTGKLLADEIPSIFGTMIWHETGKGFFYTKADKNWRSKELFFHTIGDDVINDRLIYREEDDTFSVRVRKTASRNYIVLTTSSALEAEKYYLNARELNFDLTLMKEREDNIRFIVSDGGQGYFYYVINDKGNNFRVIRTPVEDPANRDLWVEVVPHDDKKSLVDLSSYHDKFVLEYTLDGLNHIVIYNKNFEQITEIKFSDPVYEAGLVYTTYDAPKIRYYYTSLRTPSQVFEYDVKTAKSELLKQQEVPSGFNHDEYKVERIWVKARDGEMVPTSVLYKKDLFKGDGSNPMYLYGYGSYGVSMPVSFRTSILSLVNRGFVYVLSHIRGGGYLGLNWHEKAKFTDKKRTFHDFIDITECFVDKNYTKPKNIVIAGGSAGGMLMGYCANERPDLYKAVVSHVPFVDVINTMLDASLPLTPGEYKEWGNPEDKEIFDYMLTYSPYENIKVQEYPHFFITAGLSDPRVTYWEPAKYTAKLRELKTDDNYLFLKTNMAAGHAGKPGRYDSLREVAEEYNIILNLFL